MKKHFTPALFAVRCLPLLALSITLLAFSTCSINLHHDHSRRFVFTTIPDGWTYQQIFLSREGDTAEFQLTTDPIFGCMYPVWAPDGSRIAFAALTNGDLSAFNVYVMDGKGSGKINISQNHGLGSSWPSWSPDGRKIAWMTLTSGGDMHLIVADADGSNQQDVTPSLNVFTERPPSWSPDSRIIVVCADIPAMPPEPAAGYEIVVVDVQAKTYRQLTNNAVPDINPVWSPDGRKIAYQRVIGTYRLVTCNPDGSGELVLTNNGGDNRYPAWSLDGRHILFLSDGPSHSGVFSLRVTPRDGIYQDHEICDQSLSADSPLNFSPDGQTVVCVTNASPFRILKVRTDGSGYEVLLSTIGYLGNPAWAPR